MQLNKITLDVLKSFSTINQNLVIYEGQKIRTISTSKDVMASFDCEETFDKQVAIYNLNELLGVLSAFDKPELELGDDALTVTQGQQTVNYVYAEPKLLFTPPSKPIKFPGVDVTFTLSESNLSKLMKMSAILSANDLAVIGNGKTIVLKVFDKKNPTCNEFSLDTGVETAEKFQVFFKFDRMKVFQGGYTVEISKALISRFTHSDLSLVYYIALEEDSSFA